MDTIDSHEMESLQGGNAPPCDNTMECFGYWVGQQVKCVVMDYFTFGLWC